MDLDKLIAELESCRQKNAELNRRCQRAEAGVLEKVERSDGSLGRALANAAVPALKAEVERLRAENERLQEEWMKCQNRRLAGR